MGSNRFVVPIPFWLYVVGGVFVCILWTGAVIAIGVLILAAVIVVLLIALFGWLRRAVQGSSDRKKNSL